MVRKKKHKTPYLQAFWQVGCLIGVMAIEQKLRKDIVNFLINIPWREQVGARREGR